MIKKVLSGVVLLLLEVSLIFLLAEGFCFVWSVPKGASKFIESVVIREGLLVKKPEGEFRIFAYGESTMHGSHYWPLSNPGRWLEAYLRDFLPGKKIRVVNFSRMGSESDFTFRAFRDTLAYQPDLVLFYNGHNELLAGNLNSEFLAKQKCIGTMLEKLVRQSRFVSWVIRKNIKWRMKFRSHSLDDQVGYDEVELRPAEDLTTQTVPRTGAIYQEEIGFFRQKLLDVIALARKHKVPIFFLKPVGNLKDFAPSVSSHLKKLTPEKLNQWEYFFRQGKKADAGSEEVAARQNYEKAYEIDDSHAELDFRLGHVYFKLKKYAMARRLFEQARDNDAVIVRATRDIHRVYEALVQTQGIHYINPEPVLNSEVEGGILGEPVIEDNVHFSIKAHALVGRFIAEEIAKRNFIAPRLLWKFDRVKPYERMMEELGITRELIFSACLKMVSYLGPRYENRIRYAERALAIHPNHPQALRHLAWTYWLLEEKEKALEIYRKINRIDPVLLKNIFERQSELKVTFRQKFPNEVLNR